MKGGDSPRRRIATRDAFLARVAEGLDQRTKDLEKALAGVLLPDEARLSLAALRGFSHELSLIARPEVIAAAGPKINLGQTVRSLIDAHRSELDDRRHDLAISISGSALVTCAEGDVDTVLLELLSNAAKYGKGLIEVRVDATRTHARLTILDGGAGIPPRLRRKVTGRFVRGVTSSGARGFGVGLWLVRKIARDHGGDLKLGGPEGIRVTFRRAED